MSADFFDTNILVYLFDETDARKQMIAAGLVEKALESGSACISFQVVQETLNVLTRKLQRPATPAEAGRLLNEVLMPLWRGAPSPAFYRRGLELQQRYSLSFYDALIVAAALEAGCTRLLSEDLQDGLRIERLTVENPFKS
ncbi:MAG: PIN domain-containing protein [Thermoanaerobaculia bacterium]|nr:PIN domain-containing protein [Thermoanaerobaculia bacterium]